MARRHAGAAGRGAALRRDRPCAFDDGATTTKTAAAARVQTGGWGAATGWHPGVALVSESPAASRRPDGPRGSVPGADGAARAARAPACSKRRFKFWAPGPGPRQRQPSPVACGRPSTPQVVAQLFGLLPAAGLQPQGRPQAGRASLVSPSAAVCLHCRCSASWARSSSPLTRCYLRSTRCASWSTRCSTRGAPSRLSLIHI